MDPVTLLSPREDTSQVVTLARPRRDWVPVAAAAILVGIVCGGPHWLMWRQLRAQGKAYAPLVTEGVTAPTFDETTYYAPRIREVLDGHPLSADLFGWEHKKDRAYLGHSWIDALLGAALALALGRSVPALYIVCDFLLPPVAFLLTFLICRRLGASRMVSIAASLASVLASDQVTAPIAFALHPTWTHLCERLHLTVSTRPLEITRFTVPELAYLICTGAVLGLLNIHYAPRLRRSLVTGVLLGALFYSYMFYWSFVLLGGALLMVGSLVTGRERRAVPYLLLALGVGVVLGLPVICQGLMPEGFSNKAELLSRLSWGGRHVAWSRQKHDLVLLALLLLLFPRRRREWVPLFSFVLAPFACIIGSRLLRVNIQDWHWMGRCWQPWSMLTAVLLLAALWQWAADRLQRRRGGEADPAVIPRRERRMDWCFGVLGGLVLLYAANSQYRYAAQMAPSYTFAPGVQQALTELQLRAPRDSVVLCLDANMLAMVPVYTHCNVYLPYCIMSSIPTYELIDRAAITLATFGVPRSRIHSMLLTQKERKWEDVALFRGNSIDWGNWLFHQMLPYSGGPPSDEREMAVRAEFYGPQAALENARRYRVDFVLWGPTERRMGDPALEKAWAERLFIDAGDVKVYRTTVPQVRQWKPAP